MFDPLMAKIPPQVIYNVILQKLYISIIHFVVLGYKSVNELVAPKCYDIRYRNKDI